MEHKRVKITNCPGILLFVKAIKESTGKSLLECRNIVDLIRVKNDPTKLNGILLLNESSITPKQWKEIAKNTPDLKWEYV